MQSSCAPTPFRVWGPQLLVNSSMISCYAMYLPSPPLSVYLSCRLAPSCCGPSTRRPSDVNSSMCTGCTSLARVLLGRLLRLQYHTHHACPIITARGSDDSIVFSNVAMFIRFVYTITHEPLQLSLMKFCINM